MSGQKKTILEAIELAAERLEQEDVYFGHGTDNSFDEALSLVLYVLNLDYSIAEEELQRDLAVSDENKIDAIIQQRIETRQPAPYLTNRTWFMGLEFYVDERVLVPRSPIAELICAQYRPWLKRRPGLSILDLCTGSGCIAIASAVAIAGANVVASDISQDALQVCEKNIRAHKLEHRVEAIQSDLFENLKGRKFDLIVTNPPYVPQQESLQLPQEYLHEPGIGLFSGSTGLDIPLEILKQAGDYLSDSGVLIMEVGESQQCLMDMAPQYPLIWQELEYGGEGVAVIKKYELAEVNSALK